MGESFGVAAETFPTEDLDNLPISIFIHKLKFVSGKDYFSFVIGAKQKLWREN